MQWLNPTAAWALAALVYIPLLYMLRRRYVDTPVPSTLLWRRALADRSANKPIQKLKRNLLMALQLLAALSLALALMRPALPSGASGDTVLVFDLSASMQTYSGGKTRLERALEHATNAVDALADGSRISVLTSGRQTRQLLSRSADVAEVKRVLRTIQAENGRADLSGALSLSRAMQADIEALETLVYTDAALPIESDALLLAPFEDADNASVLSLAALGGQALARVANYGAARTLTLECYADGVLCDARSLDLTDGEVGQVRFDVPSTAKHMRARILEYDALPLDNAYDLIVQSATERNVMLAGSGNVFLENALTLDGGVTVARSSTAEAAISEGFQLIIFDGEQPEALPTFGNLMLIVPGQRQTPATLTRAQGDSASRITRSMPLNGVVVSAYTKLSAGTPVLLADGDPVLSVEQRGAQTIVLIGFDLHDSNLPVKLDFPILIQNLLAELLPEPVSGARDASCGQDVSLAPDVRAIDVQVVLPDGSARVIAGPGTFSETDQVGVYRLEQTVDEELRITEFALNMPRTESDVRVVAPSDAYDDGHARVAGALGGRELTWLAVLLSLMLLLIEWWVNQRGI